MTARITTARSSTPRSVVSAAAGAAFLATFLMIGGAHAQSIRVKIDGLSDRAVHQAIVSAATQVCRADDYSPLAPLAEAGCVEDTVVVAQRQVAELRRAHADFAVLEVAARPAPVRR